ncbi:putative RNA-directed DNA polymerase from transposon BS [Araneus ventricosus]|uniref:Putative RNA-directed DNA polymerase from transposon BS n=1 Tax=Araneus ventricosus TaxID=182803 RepID=A0A4Y2LA96_ARAVE|nr:putative RNA-directed DNA polymerase from transposon BS [Araneus ventricosus]
MLLSQCSKTDVVIPIPKPNQNLEMPQKYRPISLLSSLNKLYESLLLKRLNQFLDINHIIISEQFGSRKNLSTSHQLLYVTVLIHDGFANFETTGALFLDVAKAFDKIWQDGLLAKFMRLSCSAQFIKITHSFLTSRTFRVRVNNILSNPRPILSGCSQGSLLSPALFNVYVNDIPKPPRCQIAILEDDTTILTKHKHPGIAVKALQSYVSQLQLWLTDWKIQVNPNVEVLRTLLVLAVLRSDFKFTIEKLQSAKDWTTWKMSVMLLLKTHDLLSYVTEDKTLPRMVDGQSDAIALEEARKKFELADAKAL